jgi:Arc/MetJ family transcription regulator
VVGTSVVLDAEVLEEVRRLTGIETKHGLVHEARRVLVEARKRKNLLEPGETNPVADDYDHQALRDERR